MDRVWRFLSPSTVKMVPSPFTGSFVSRSLYLISSRIAQRTDHSTYVANTVDAVDTLQGWYNQGTGLWDSTGWWNSANCLTVLADFAALNSSDASSLNIPSIIQTTYAQAQKTTVQAQKTITASGMTISSYTRVSKRDNTIAARGFDNFLNDYYDDEGWWALALIHSSDLGVQGLGDQDYLGAANVIYQDMKKGVSPCGGIYWSKVTNYTNAIANELFLSVAASLANRMPNKADYLTVAQNQWNWFKNSGMINSNNLINDGLTTACKNNGQNTWTYTQGVILGGLVELYKATGNKTLLTEATTIALAAINAKSMNGILYEGCEPNCGDDGAQFKGIFMRNLRYLHEVAPNSNFSSFIRANADSIWAKDRNTTNNQLGVTWTGPYTAATAGSHSSALDALIAAVALGG